MFRRSLRWFLWLLLAAGIATKVVDWWSEMWWYDEVTLSSTTETFTPDYRAVYFKMMATRLAGLVLGAGLFGSVLWLNARIAWRVVQKSSGLADVEASMRSSAPLIALEDQLRIDRFRLWIVGGGAGVTALLAGVFAALQWVSWLRFTHASSLHQADPIFGLDLSFYLFRLPLLNFAWSFIFCAGIATFVLVTAIYAYEDVFEIGGSRTHLTTPVLRHLCAIGAGLLLWKALGYRLSAYNLLTGQNGFVFGAGYTDVHWRLPLQAVLAVAALAAAGFLLWRGWRGDARRAAWAPAAYLLASWLAGSLVPRLVQATVAPNEQVVEVPYIAHQLEWTRRSYGLDRVRAVSPAASPSGSLRPETLRATAEGLPAWSVGAARQAFAALPGTDNYAFSPPDIDRYVIGNEVRPVIVAAREVAPARIGNPTWHNRHLGHINGDGLVICDAFRTDAQGQPIFYLRGQPPRAESGASFRVARPEIFFGALQPPPPGAVDMLSVAAPNQAPYGSPRRMGLPAYPEYAVVNARHAATAPSETKPEVDTLAPQYHGRGGVVVGSILRKWLLAWRFRDPRLALAADVTADSRVLWHRRVVERCQRIAPFLSYEGSKPYPVLADEGRIVWMLDAFSLSDAYPYAQPSYLLGANSIRNAAKATVDAYNGDVHFYVADPTDPFVQVYQRVFPHLFRPLDAMPRDLRRHARYPFLLLAAQAEIWARYHVTSPDALFAGTDVWTATLLTRRRDFGGREEALPAPFASLPLRGMNHSPGFYTWNAFSSHALTRLGPGFATTMVPDKLAALLLADGDYEEAGSAGRPRLFEWRAPVARPVPQAEESTSSLGTLAVAPAGDALVYVQGNLPKSGGVEGPSLVASSRLRKTIAIVTAAGTGTGASVEGALRDLHRSKSSRGRIAAPPVNRLRPAPAAEPAAEPADARLAQARAQFQAMQNARQRRDWTAYGEAEKQLRRILGGS